MNKNLLILALAAECKYYIQLWIGSTHWTTAQRNAYLANYDHWFSHYQ
jgi:hypothetical protein